MKGSMELLTIQRGKRKSVKILEGQVYGLPSCVPYCPQRPGPGSVGLVVERVRREGELDGLRWYTNFKVCDKVLWERFFQCSDMEKDFRAMVEAFEASEEFKTRRPGATVLAEKDRPLQQNDTADVPAPLLLKDFLSANGAKLAAGMALPLFGTRNAPEEGELSLVLAGGPSESWGQLCAKGDTFYYQLQGVARIAAPRGTIVLEEGCCCLVQRGISHDVCRTEGSVGLVLRLEPGPLDLSKGSGAAAAPPAKAASTSAVSSCPPSLFSQPQGQDGTLFEDSDADAEEKSKSDEEANQSGEDSSDE
jgi:3-hydroxyanthranilate 3,4-dioxygenase